MLYDASKGITILAIDTDVPFLRAMSALVKEKLPWRIVAAQKGIKALDFMRKNPVHLVLLEIDMPKMDGFKILDLIHHYEETQGVPVIFLTKIRDQSTVVKAIAAKVDDYIKKPVNPPEVLERIVTFIKKSVKFTVLIVDDEEKNLNAAKEILEKNFPYKIEVLTANAAPAGLEIIDNKDVNLLILDDDLPIINGIRMLELLKSKEQFGKFPVIFMPTDLEAEGRFKLAEFNIKFFAEKPFQAGELIKTTQEALNVCPPPNLALAFAETPFKMYAD